MYHNFRTLIPSIMLFTAPFLVGGLEPSVEAPVLRKIQNRAFAEGEELIFSIEYGPIKAGTGVMKVLGIEDIHGKRCYHVISEAKSSSFFSYFFRVDDRMDSYIDVDGIFSRRFEKRIREGKFRSDQTVVYDQEKNLVFFKGDSIRVSPFVQDALSVFYYVRTQELEVGKVIVVDSFTDGKLYSLKIKVLGIEEVEVKAGRFKCFVIEPSFRGTSIFRQKGKLKIWLTKDERKIPVLMKSKAPFGSIYAKLIKYRINDGQQL